MWHYLCFIVLVKVKDSTEYTGPESYVAEMIKVSLEFCFSPPLLPPPRLDQSTGMFGKYSTRILFILQAKTWGKTFSAIIGLIQCLSF